MSRSYKKHPWCTDGKNGQVKPKRLANKAVRKYKYEISNGNYYKRLFCSWNIHDYAFRLTWAEAKEEYESDSSYRKKYLTLEELYKFWIKHYRSK